MSGIKGQYKAYKARKLEKAEQDKAKEAKVKFFKNQFGVKLDDKSWDKVRAGMNTGLAELLKWVTRIEQAQGQDAADARNDYNTINTTVSMANQTFSQDPKLIGTQIRDAILPDLRDLIDHYRIASKNTPLTSVVNGRTVEVFWTDIPGYDDLAPNEQAQVVQALAAKTERGLAAYDNLANGGQLPNAVTPAEATDFIWAMKSKAQKKAGPYAKGAMTIPNGDVMRQYLDKCTVVYPRASSHLKEQQKRPGQSPRGMDFYDGAGNLAGTPPDVDGMLPFGMNTVLYQQVTGSGGDQILYIKMETEGAPGTGGGNLATDPTAPPDPPGPTGTKAKAALKLGNAIKTVKHGKNFVKSAISKDNPDKDVASTREEMPSELRALCAQILKAMPKGPAKASLASAFGKKKLFRKQGKSARIHAIYTVIEGILTTPDAQFTDEWLTLVVDFIDQCNAMSNAADTENRFGSEVVLTANDL